MIEIKYKIWPYLKPSGQVAIRVLWNSCKTKVEFATDVYAEKSKWDDDMHKAKSRTTHFVKNKAVSAEFSAEEINEQVALFKDAIEGAFFAYAAKNSVPTNEDLKAMVNNTLGRGKDMVEDSSTQKKSLGELYDEFIKKGTREKNWDYKCIEKYDQAYNHFISANPLIQPRRISEAAMFNLRDWYVKNEYKNRTINKQFIMLKAFLKYINNTGEYTIPSNVLNFETNFKVIRRTVTFLHYNELIAFSQFKFKESDSRLDKARDFWCFMAFTSLRYSDLQRLKPGHIIDDKRIEMIAQKTAERLSIPLTEGALKIIEKYKDQPGPNGLLFDVPTNQKMNDYIKEAAKVAGIDREIINTYFVGTERKEVSQKFYDIIGCHDARRTFVSCSLAMGIPPQVVMKCTGHSGYATMKPYIETATETQSIEMEKWNRSQYKSQIITLLEDASEDDLKAILEVIKKKVVMKQDITKESEDKNEVKDMESDVPIISTDDDNPITDVEDDTPINIMEEIAKGNIIHVEYALEEDDESEMQHVVA